MMREGAIYVSEFSVHGFKEEVGSPLQTQLHVVLWTGVEGLLGLG